MVWENQQLVTNELVEFEKLLVEVQHYMKCSLATRLSNRLGNILLISYWQLFFSSRRGNLGPQKSFSMMQCLFDKPLIKILKPLNMVCFFLRSSLPWIIWRQRNDFIIQQTSWRVEKTHKLCGMRCLIMVESDGNTCLRTLEKPWMLLIKMFLMNRTWCDVLKDLLPIIVIYRSPETFGPYEHHFLISSWPLGFLK